MVIGGVGVGTTIWNHSPLALVSRCFKLLSAAPPSKRESHPRKTARGQEHRSGQTSEWGGHEGRAEGAFLPAFRRDEELPGTSAVPIGSSGK